MKYACLAVLTVIFLTACVESGNFATTHQYKPQVACYQIGFQAAGMDICFEHNSPSIMELKTRPEYVPEIDYSPIDYTPIVHTSDVILIAHAGGQVHGYEGANTIEAIRNAHSQNFRYIELDMITTSDRRIVLKHSWRTAGNIFGGARNGIMSHYEFMGQSTYGRFTPTDLCMLIAFLEENPGPRIITDTKATNYAALYEIASRFPEFMYRFIPQVYQFGDARRIRALGFEDIILTSYMMADHNPGQIRDYALQNGLYAVGIPDGLATRAFISALNPSMVRIFVHTIDDIARAEQLMDLGVQMLMTGFLTYTDELDGIRLADSPLPVYFDMVVANMYNLNESERNLAAIAKFYRMKNPVFVIAGRAQPISGSKNMMVEIFTSRNQVYFALRNFVVLTESVRMDGSSRHIRVDGSTHVLRREDYHIFRGFAFISEDLVESIFGLRVLRCGDYIAIVRSDDAHLGDELLHVARKVFASGQTH